MSVNSIDVLSKGLQELPSVTPPSDMLETVRGKIRRRKARQRQFTQFGAVSFVAIAVFGMVLLNQPYLEETEVLVAGSSQQDSDSQVLDLDVLTPLQRDLQENYSQSTIAKAAIIVRLADLNTELASLPSVETDRRNELLEQKDALKRTYRLIRRQPQEKFEGYL